MNFNNTNCDRHDFHSPSPGACEIEFLCMLFAHRWLSYQSLLSRAFAFLPWPFTVNFCSLDVDPRYLRMPSTQPDFQGFSFMEVEDELFLSFCRKLWNGQFFLTGRRIIKAGFAIYIYIHIIYEHVYTYGDYRLIQYVYRCTSCMIYVHMITYITCIYIYNCIWHI